MYLSYVLALVGDRGREVIDDMYGEPGGERREDEGLELEGAAESGRVVHRGAPKVVVALDFRRLVELATEAEARVDIAVGVGDTVPDGAVMARIAGGRLAEEQVRRRRSCSGTSGRWSRTPSSRSGSLVDVAIKALSPAVNDPTTAVQALDQIEDPPAPDRPAHARSRPARRRPRLHPRHVSRRRRGTTCWRSAIDEIRMCGSDSLQVVRRLRLLLENLEATVTADDALPSRDRLERLDAAIEREIPPADRADAHVADPQGLGLSRLRVEPGPA